MGEALGSNKSIVNLSINVCNLESLQNMKALVTGLQQNQVVQRLNLSDNNLGDEVGIQVLNMIKYQSEQRDSAQWCAGLRSTKSITKAGGKSKVTKLNVDTDEGGDLETDHQVSYIKRDSRICNIKLNKGPIKPSHNLDQPDSKTF